MLPGLRAILYTKASFATNHSGWTPTTAPLTERIGLMDGSPMSPSLRFARWFLLCVIYGLALWSLIWGIEHALTDSADLLRRLEEVELVVQRIDPYTDPDMTYPPSAVPLFVALLGPVPRHWVPAFWLGLNLAAAVALAMGIRAVWGRGWDVTTLAIVGGWLIAARPFRAGVALGQFHLIPTALLIGTVPLLERGRAVSAGLLLGLALCKPNMALPVALAWLVRREWRALGVAAGVQGVLWLAASAWIGQSPLRLGFSFLHNARGQLQAGSLDLPSLLARVGLAEGVAPLLGTLAVLGISVVVLARTQAASGATALAFALVTAAIFTYHRHYDLVLLLPAVVALGASDRHFAKALALGFALLLILPTNPGWMRPFVGTVDFLVAASAYGLWTLLAGMLHLEHCRRSRDSHTQTENVAVIRGQTRSPGET